MKPADIGKAAKKDIGAIMGVGKMYSLMRRLSKINGAKVSPSLLNKVMYRSEELPLLGKEYWWFLFFGKSGKTPVQLMLLIFRKHGRKMIFDGREMAFKGLGKNSFRAVTAGWVYDGKKLRDLGDTNAIVRISGKRITSEIAGERLTISGGFPDYRIRLGKTIDLRAKKGGLLEDRDAYGVFVPPFGMAWADAYLDVKGSVLGKKFEGTSHLQKVFGVSIFGPFHWGRVVFENSSAVTFFCFKTGKDSQRQFGWYMIFYDRERNRIIRFHRPKIKVSKFKGGQRWVAEGKDRDSSIRLELESYAKREFTMKGGGSQVYVEYAVVPKSLTLKTKNRTITLKDLGKGVGTLEDAYW